jgi:TPR repeat protein
MKGSHNIMAEVSDFAAAQQLYSDGKWTEAFTALKPLAETGNADAQYLLAECYAMGLHRAEEPLGTKAQVIQQSKDDQEEAIRWYTLAGEQDHGWACHDLALLYSESYLGDADWSEVEAKAKFYLERAEQLGVPVIIFHAPFNFDTTQYFETARNRYLERKQRRQENSPSQQTESR